MLTIRKHLRPPLEFGHQSVENPTLLSLTHDARKRSRQRLPVADGRELALALVAGTVLSPGDLLQADNDEWFLVQARPEALLRVRGADHRSLLAAAYHLGNRHVPVQVAPDFLLLEPDNVLRDMLLRLGLDVDEVMMSFQPEPGAYGGGHRHGHDAHFAEDHALAQAGYRAHAAIPFRDRSVGIPAPAQSDADG